jgi:hypothetical protein
MGHIITYKNETDKGLYCQIKFASGESVLIAMVGSEVKMFKVAIGGLIPVKTLWRSINAAESIRLFIDEDAPLKHPLDTIQDHLMSDNACEEAKVSSSRT